MNKITKEKLKTWSGLTVGDLKKFIENNNVPDDVLVMIERVKDMYYEGIDISGFQGCSTTEDGKYPPGSKTEGWGVYLKEGQDYHYCINHNKKIQSGEYLNKEEYPSIEEDSTLLKEFSEEELENSKTQYHPAWSCVKYKDEDDFLFIDLHC